MWALLLLFSPADGPPPAARRRRPAAAPPAEAAPSAGAGGYPAARWPRRSPPSAAAARTAPGGASGRTASGCIGATGRSPPPAAPAEARRCSPGAAAPCGTAAQQHRLVHRRYGRRQPAPQSAAKKCHIDHVRLTSRVVCRALRRLMPRWKFPLSFSRRMCYTVR